MIEPLQNHRNDARADRKRAMTVDGFYPMIGRSEALTQVLFHAKQVAPTDANVLILGETGTGKELLAHAIHKLSCRQSRPFVRINCATLPATLIESELFGHERGAFTGADTKRIGRFETANGGTILLDEIGELPLELQPKLLRVLEEGEFDRVGGVRTVRIDVRVIAATNRDLAFAARRGLFRSDLYYRLNSYPITLPPLRERRQDIPELLDHFLKELNTKLGKDITSTAQDTMSALMKHNWPGNVRELRNVIELAAITTQGRELQLSGNLESPLLTTQREPLVNKELRRQPEFLRIQTIQQSQYELIVRTLREVHWRIDGPDGAAALLDVNPSTLRYRMKKLGITRPRIQIVHDK